MKTKLKLSVIAAALVAMAFAGLSGHGQKRKPSRIVWEYKSTGIGSSNYGDKELNELGAQGWELVGISDGERGTVFYLKRAK